MRVALTGIALMAVFVTWALTMAITQAHPRVSKRPGWVVLGYGPSPPVKVYSVCDGPDKVFVYVGSLNQGGIAAIKNSADCKVPE